MAWHLYFINNTIDKYCWTYFTVVQQNSDKSCAKVAQRNVSKHQTGTTLYTVSAHAMN